MKYERFEQVPVWQAAIDLGRRVYALTKKREFRGQRSLRDQIERAAFPFPTILLKDLSAARRRNC